MKWYYNMKVGNKILIGFILIAIICGIIGTQVITTLNTIAEVDAALKANIAERASEQMTIILVIAIILIIIIGVYTSVTVSKPIGKISGIVEKILQGDFNVNTGMNSNDEVGVLAGNIDKVANIFRELVSECDMLANAGVEGKLATRGDVSKFTGGYRQIIKCIDTTLDAVIGPLNVAADYVDRIAKGDIPPKITDTYNGDFNTLKNNLNMAIDAINEQANAANEISKGNLGVKVTVRCENDILSKSLVEVIEVLNGLKEEMLRLTIASRDGQLSERGRAEQFQGAYADVVRGVNEMLDAILIPIGEGNRVLRLIRGGNLRERVNIDCKGEHQAMKDAINGVHSWLTELIDFITKVANGDLTAEMNKASEDDQIYEWLMLLKHNINALVNDANMLSVAAVEGRLETRADASKHGGDFRKIVEGVNATLDAVIGPLNVAADYVDKISKGNIPPKITDSYNGDFNTLKNNLNTCIDAVNALVADANMLSVAAVEGRLETRADASKHGGDFRKIVEGVNATLDAVIEPIKEALVSLQEMANHNLTVTMNGNYKGDHDKLKEALNNSLNSFNQVLLEINNSADMVAMGSKQVSDSSQALSQGSTEQASSIEEITASITQAAVQVKHNAENAGQANELAESAKEYAVSGNNQMGHMLKAMEEINESSGNISKIIKVIDDIAFQTNILALNAAVEAARAGQHGKGFAVVAEEVRNLAAKSANAAKETTGLIEGSIKKAEAGTKIATETAESLSKIVEKVSQASNLVAEIASASNEQATAIAQINQAINQVAQVTQMNTATAEESASASEELSSQAEALKSMIEKFKLKKQDNSSKGMVSSDQDMMKLIEEALKKKMGNGSSYKATEAVEEAAQEIEPKAKISLDDKEFGKY